LRIFLAIGTFVWWLPRAVFTKARHIVLELIKAMLMILVFVILIFGIYPTIFMLGMGAAILRGIRK